MKIAIPTRDNRVDDHFGHCEKYTLISVNENQEIREMETINSPKACGCKSDIASVLREKKVDVMLAGNMGQGALNVLNRHGIRVIRGCHGEVAAVAEAYLLGDVYDSGQGCSQHEHSHAHDGCSGGNTGS